MMREWADRKSWNEALLAVPPYSGQFLHSWEWGACLEARGKEVVRLGDEDALMMLVREKLPFRREYLYSPKGPLLRGEDGVWEEILEAVRERARNKTIFFRFESRLNPPEADLGGPSGLKKVSSAQPERTILVNLEQSEDELLAAMHEKMRYNVRLAERRGVRCEMKGVESADEFWRLLQETKERDKFRTHERTHYGTLLKALANDPAERSRASARLLVASFEGAPVAANLLVFFGDVVTYLHGASGNTARNVMAPALLHWQAMKLAKKLGYRLYDLWGIDEKRWPGLTRFKRGFGGEEVASSGSWELSLNHFWYTLYSLAKRMRP
ncbi:MAG: peptidoglycan bridge formation glycyltransferase FemA/FemB family protein [Patescibacteria group bacterium]